MLWPFVAVIGGLLLLLWSADRFVEGAAMTARYAGMSPLLIGMLIVGFGTSAPEMVVSGFSAAQGNPGLALGNAFGSNIANIALILGVTAILSPIPVKSRVLRKELPVCMGVTVLAVLLLLDGRLSRLDAWVLLAVFSALMFWSLWQGRQPASDPLAVEMEQELRTHTLSRKGALAWLLLGLLLLIVSSRVLVWGAVAIAHTFGVSDLVIGLTVVAIGTSLPELASSLAAARKGEHEIALGNVLGSNLFNTLAVVGIAGAIHPLEVAREVLTRDCLVMSLLTLSLFALGYGFRGRPGRINRLEGLLLLSSYVFYSGWVAWSVLQRQ